MATAAVASLDFLLRQPNALLAEPDTPKPCDRLYVPQSYLRYLSTAQHDEFVRFGSGRQTLLRNFTQIIEQLNSDLTQPFTSPNGLYVCFFQPNDVDGPTTSDPTKSNPVQQAIIAAQELSTNYPHIPIFTYDPALSTLAALSSIPTVALAPPAPHPGRRTVQLSDEALEWFSGTGNQPIALTTWQQQINPSIPLRPNEFIEISNPPHLTILSLSQFSAVSTPNLAPSSP